MLMPKLVVIAKRGLDIFFSPGGDKKVQPLFTDILAVGENYGPKIFQG